jgi:hypothetical protein
VVPIICPGRRWWLEPVSSFSAAGSRRSLVNGGVQDSVTTESGHTRHQRAILSLFLALNFGGSCA